MLRLIAILLLAAVPATARPASRGKVVVDELAPLSRRDDPLVFGTYVATTYDPARPAPLILGLHAGRGSARQFTGFLRFLAEARGAVLVCPQGLEEIVGADGYWWKGNRKEMAAIERVLEHVRKCYKLDAKRFTLVGLADGAELGIRWALTKDRGLSGLIALNFLWKWSGTPHAPKELRICLIAGREAKEKRIRLRDQARKAAAALRRAKYPVVLRIVPGASRSFFSGWEKTFGKAYAWFEGKLDWPAEIEREALAPPPEDE